MWQLVNGIFIIYICSRLNTKPFILRYHYNVPRREVYFREIPQLQSTEEINMLIRSPEHGDKVSVIFGTSSGI
jgi:hypothetical protein